MKVLLVMCSKMVEIAREDVRKVKTLRLFFRFTHRQVYYLQIHTNCMIQMIFLLG